MSKVQLSVEKFAQAVTDAYIRGFEDGYNRAERDYTHVAATLGADSGLGGQSLAQIIGAIDADELAGDDEKSDDTNDDLADLPKAEETTLPPSWPDFSGRWTFKRSDDSFNWIDAHPDKRTREFIWSIVTQLEGEGFTFLEVSHYPEYAHKYHFLWEGPQGQRYFSRGSLEHCHEDVYRFLLNLGRLKKQEQDAHLEKQVIVGKDGETLRFTFDLLDDGLKRRERRRSGWGDVWEIVWDKDNRAW